ncbi:MAG: hypothetical protein J6J30_04285 [Clostridia bacterium]|jgi:hypothetical protein|nr:hypothetical protein [Clostridia bacterium]
MKKAFLEICKFNIKDVITTSNVDESLNQGGAGNTDGGGTGDIEING